MRPHGTTKWYALLLVLAVTLIVFFAAPLWAEGDVPFVVYPFMFVVAAYSFRQLLRPTPKVSPVRDSSAYADKFKRSI
jgi:hypothetical protein